MATRAAASRAASALARRVRLIRLAPDSIKPPCTVAVMDRPPPVLASSPLFSLHMRPLRAPPEAARPGLPPLVGPAWLPRPPQRATHAPRHLDRWRGAADGETPFYVIVLAGKKRVHKLAVIRNRCRARLVAALRAVVQHERLPILPRTWAKLTQTWSMYFSPRRASTARA